MNFTKTAVTLGIAALAATAAPSAMAQGTGWYAGGNIGSTGVSIDDDRIRSGLATQGLGTTSIDDRDQDWGYKLYGGYQFHPNFGIEAGYFDLGRFGYTANTSPSGSLTGDVRIKGLNLDLVGTWPFTNKFSAFARVGVNYARVEGRFSAVPLAQVPYPSSSTSETSANVKYGLGLAYAFNESWSMRVEAERYHIDDSVGNKGHADMISAAVVYRFGAKPQPVAAAPAPRPAFVAAAPAPAPLPAPVVVAPAPVFVPMPAPVVAAPPMRVTLSADSLFDFDKATVKPAGRAALDKLANDLRGIRYDSIAVTGHTDRLGSDSYNAALSQRRATAVSDYLVQSGGVPSGMIAARGQGESQPETKDCRGTTQTPALIACLQPDRRVEVEVSGTSR